MEIDFDPAKDAANIAKHGVSLTLALALFTGRYRQAVDDRHEYGEVRIKAKGHVAGRLVVCVYTWRNGRRRIISLRKANRREQDAYEAGWPGRS